jgi:hypothetical protein
VETREAVVVGSHRLFDLSIEQIGTLDGPPDLVYHCAPAFASDCSGSRNIDDFWRVAESQGRTQDKGTNPTPTREEQL